MSKLTENVQLCNKYLSFLVPPKPNIMFPKYSAGNGHSCNTSTDQLQILAKSVVISLHSLTHTHTHIITRAVERLIILIALNRMIKYFNCVLTCY